jgi:hypothetical protein
MVELALFLLLVVPMDGLPWFFLSFLLAVVSRGWTARKLRIAMITLPLAVALAPVPTGHGAVFTPAYFIRLAIREWNFGYMHGVLLVFLVSWALLFLTSAGVSSWTRWYRRPRLPDRDLLSK